MSECDAYKLIEEFIKKSADMPEMKQSDLELPPTLLGITSSEYSITNSSSSSFISSYLGLNKSTKEQTVLETPPETPEQIKAIQLPVKEDNLKPTRPYSYYVATNFHPLDLSVLTTQTDAPLETTITESGVKKRTKKHKRDDNKRLSMSLSDIKTDKIQAIEPSKKTYSFFRLNSKKSKSNQHNLDKDYEETDDETFTKSSHISFKRMSVFNSTMPARISSKNRSTNSPNQHQPGKLNKFFRNLFRINEKKSDELDTSQANFKFSRLFSFRHSPNAAKNVSNNNSSSKQADRSNSTSTNGTQCPLQLVVTDEQPSKIILPQITLEHQASIQQCSPESRDLTEFNESYKLDNLEILKEKFYSEVADRLKKIASCTNSSANFSQEKSSLSSIDLIDIPYIDEEDEQSVYNLYSCSDLTISQASSKLLKTDMSDLAIEESKLHDFIQNSTYSKFDELAIEYLNKYDSVWNKIAILFELIHRSVQMVRSMKPRGELNQALVIKLKEIAANYIHDKYCDWIYKNGGWKSVPDIISLPRESNERSH